MTHILSASTLDDLVPAHRLSKEGRSRLASTGQITTIASGRRLTAIQEYPWLGYLLSGKVCILDGDRKEIVEAGTMRACQPLLSENRLREQVLFITEGELLRLDRQLFQSLDPDASGPEDVPDRMDLSEGERSLFASIDQASKDGSLSLPSMPKVARAIQEAMSDRNITSARLARIVQMDLAVTGGLIRLSNSAMYRGVKPIADVRNAIIRLGMDLTRSVVMSLAMQQVFRTRSPLVKHFMKATWNRSVHISALGYVIARRCEGLNPEEALLAGLLCDVGVVPILDYVSRHYRDIEDDALEAALLRLKGRVGELVMADWGLGSDLIQVVRESERWYRDSGERPDYCDIVLVARLYRLHQSEPRGPLPRYDEVPAYFNLGLGTEAGEQEADFISEASEQISEVMAMLKGDK
ncbi:HDOD domain-containing protein [Imhoffiella purpurea]|uniref:HDOD domain-containing protein n=1 Tax=Imhoffiella purpurea TaxID=1249627 RepID=W9V782_9GAMM|nr:HDOD domain-containing protein [Imhoffiella purpurea]EXJ15413.1 hypothetical protein D779_1377 [Imhoffiella purpurea]